MNYDAKDPLFRQKLIEIGDEIRKSTILLLVKDEVTKFRPYGTGVLYSNSFRNYIITAAHVTDRQLFAVSGNAIMALTGTIKQIEVKSKNIDVCYMILDLRTFEFLSEGYEFISKSKVYLGDKPVPFLRYLVIGFPSITTKVSPNANQIHASARYYNLRMSKDNVYNYYKLDKSLQYALDFKGKMENYGNSTTQKIEEPYGVSGSGLWVLAQKDKDEIMYNLDFKLIGIMTEYRKGKYHCLIGNKIELISNSLEDIGGTYVSIKTDT